MSTSSTSETTEDMPYLAAFSGVSIVKPVPMTGM